MTDLTQSLVDFLRYWGELNPASAAVLALIVIACGILPVPRTAVTLASGVVFGLAAVPVVMPSATVGALLTFLFARHLFAERVWRWVEGRPKLRAIMNAVDAEGWRIVALCRLASPIPGTIQNVVYGVTRIDAWTYTWATFVFTAPQIVLYSYLGAVGKAALVGVSGDASLALLAASGLIILIVVLLITRRLRVSIGRASR